MISIPKSSYPLAIDTDYTLLSTYDSTQSILAKELDANGTEIIIVPTVPDKPEIWPDNGFVTIEKELIYYDTSEKNDEGRICKLTDCLRKVEGKLCEGRIGTPIYGKVVAQQHNQLADVIINIEKMLGDIAVLDKMPQTNLQQRMLMRGSHFNETMNLHNSMMSLGSTAPAADDVCPRVSFTFTLLPGNIGEFCVRIEGNFTFYQLDFGDGGFTNDTFEGTYAYLSSAVAPIVTVTNTGCTIVLTPETPQPGCNVADITPPAVSFGVPIPALPGFPNFIVPKQTCPGPLIQLPPIVSVSEKPVTGVL